MTTFRQAWARLVSFFRKQQLDREFDAELAVHIELATQDHVERGMSLPEARRRALIELGGIEPSKELHRDSRGLPGLDGIIQDLRYAVRGLRRSPGFTLTAIATLAVGIGVNAAVFTVTNAVLFKGFPLVDRNDRILYISGGGCCVSYPDFEDYRTQAKSFEGMAIVRGVTKTLSDKSGFPESYEVTEVSADTFKLVGQKPILGRDFTPSDETPGAAPVAILSYGFWERRFGKDPGIIGRTVRMNGAPTTLIGIMPQGFSFPQKVDLWAPLVRTPAVERRDNRETWFVFGRMADGVTIESARTEMETIGRRLGSAYPLTNQGRNLLPHVQNFDEFFIGENAAMIYKAMLGAVGFVLLIACANLANLMLARAMGRSREISVRVALGAGRWRIMRQLLIESVMLSGLGGFAGWWVAKWGVRIYALAASGSGISDEIPGTWFDNVLDYSMDSRVIAYLIAISLGTGIVFGLVPALRLAKLDVNAALTDGARGATGGERGQRLSGLLAIGEMALAVVLLAGAGVMIRSFLNIYNADMGFKTTNILTMDLSPGKYPGAEARISFYDRLRSRLETIPGVESVAIASVLPASGSARLPYELAGAPAASAGENEQLRPMVSTVVIGPAYFRTLGAMVVLSGRDFSDADGVSGVPAAIVNQRFANQHWPGENPLGKRLRLFDRKTNMPEAWLTVVGVASNIVQDYTRRESDPLVYLPYRQRPAANVVVIARTRVPPASLATAFRSEVQAIDSDLPVGPVPLAERLAPTYRYRAVIAVLFLIFAAIALLLASVGLYAVVAHSVRRRTQELGIRIAMGATARDILELVLMQGMRPVGLGLLIGLAASLAVNRVLKSELVQVSPSDPITLVVAFAVLILAAMLGCWVPARRAMRVDPVVALRHD